MQRETPASIGAAMSSLPSQALSRGDEEIATPFPGFCLRSSTGSAQPTGGGGQWSDPGHFPPSRLESVDLSYSLVEGARNDLQVALSEVIAQAVDLEPGAGFPGGGLLADGANNLSEPMSRAVPILLRQGGNGVRSVRLTFERVASPRSCGSRAPPLRHEPQGPLLSHRSNRRVEIGSS
jgi:hypothetical protein